MPVNTNAGRGAIGGAYLLARNLAHGERAHHPAISLQVPALLPYPRAQDVQDKHIPVNSMIDSDVMGMT